MEAGVDMEDGVENEGCRAVGPDSDLTTPLLRFVVEAGIEKPDTDTAGAVQSDKDIQGHVKSAWSSVQQYQKYNIN